MVRIEWPTLVPLSDVNARAEKLAVSLEMFVTNYPIRFAGKEYEMAMDRAYKVAADMVRKAFKLPEKAGVEHVL